MINSSAYYDYPLPQPVARPSKRCGDGEQDRCRTPRAADRPGRPESGYASCQDADALPARRAAL